MPLLEFSACKLILLIAKIRVIARVGPLGLAVTLVMVLIRISDVQF